MSKCGPNVIQLPLFMCLLQSLLFGEDLNFDNERLNAVTGVVSVTPLFWFTSGDTIKEPLSINALRA